MICRHFFITILSLLLFSAALQPAPLGAADVDLEALLDDDMDAPPPITVHDPLEPMNRAFFAFNDRLYFWVLKPVGKVYSAVLADEAVRGCISNAFYNVAAPVRVVNNLLQGKFKQSATEVARFAINTVLGAGGLGDPAAEEFGIARANEDFGQTLGFYGLGEGIYLCWPVFGPSSVRDTIGGGGDYLLNPLTYLLAGDFAAGAGLSAWRIENAATLKGREYEALVRQSFDPYIAFRDIYYQHRRSLISSPEPALGQDVAAIGAGHAAGEACPDYTGNAFFDNLVKARKYQKCIERTGGQASVKRTQRQGRPVYAILVDQQAGAAQRLAVVADFAKHNEHH